MHKPDKSRHADTENEGSGHQKGKGSGRRGNGKGVNCTGTDGNQTSGGEHALLCTEADI